VVASYDAIIVGTGFASSFFLHELLARSPERARILVLEAGDRRPHAWQLDNPTALDRASEASYLNRTQKKSWILKRAFGGGSNCWWACTPRLLPNDFRLGSLYGVARDWPVSYDDLEESYSRAEALLGVAGPDDGSPFPRSRPYPQPPHRFSEPDKRLKSAAPDLFFSQPAARPSRTVAGGRPGCCNSGVCHLCPIDSKFTIENTMAALYRDPRVRLKTGALVQSVETRGAVATGVRYLASGREERANGELVVLGANAVFNPHILLRSGLEHPALGRYLHEQASIQVGVLLDGLDNFQGSTSITGHGYWLYDGAHRSDRPAILVETWNVPRLRMERGKWRQILKLMCIIEDYPQRKNRVEIAQQDPTRPAIHFEGRSPAVAKGLAALRDELPHWLAPLPVEGIAYAGGFKKTDGHALGTARMGNDPAKSVVDRQLVHHDVRNLLVLGGSAFPTSSPANPTLTISALSLWAAEKLLGG